MGDARLDRGAADRVCPIPRPDRLDAKAALHQKGSLESSSMKKPSTVPSEMQCRSRSHRHRAIGCWRSECAAHNQYDSRGRCSTMIVADVKLQVGGVIVWMRRRAGPGGVEGVLKGWPSF